MVLLSCIGRQCDILDHCMFAIESEFGLQDLRPSRFGEIIPKSVYK